MSQETDRIEADVNESRHRLSDTLSQLGGKLSPGQMLDEALGLAQGQAGQFTANLGRQVRDNPLPSVLIAAGIALYFMNARQSAPEAHARLSAEDWEIDRRHRNLEEARWRTQRLGSETEEAFSERLHAAQAKALELSQNAGEAVDNFKQRVAQTVGDLETKAQQTRDRVAQAFSSAVHAVGDGAHALQAKAGDAKHGAQNLYANNPLAGGAVALAVGAIIGALTPLSDAERSSLAGLAGRANNAGAAFAEQGARAAECAADAIH
jgi:ElaB/YqjD/DUF883 family membrane-anchored ribosome-binding protein